MGLVQVATNTVSSAVSAVTLTGIDDDSVYMVALTNWSPVNDTVVQRFRVTKSGTAQSDANYDSAFKSFYADTTFHNGALANNTDFEFEFTGNAAGESCSAILYLYNFNSSSEFSYVNFRTVGVNQSQNSRGVAGGGVHTVASASDGIQFRFHSGNVASGTFTLYKVV
jgi:hypothetical protein